MDAGAKGLSDLRQKTQTKKVSGRGNQRRKCTLGEKELPNPKV